MLVRGTVTAPAYSGVTVNGVVAIIGTNGNFYANDVPLNTGANTLTVTVNTLEGGSATNTVNVTSTGPAPIQIKTDPYEGLAPLTATFDVSNNGSVGILRTDYDFNGDGAVDYTQVGAPNALALAYPQPGIYLAKITVTDVLNNVTEKTYAIDVKDEAQMDAMFRALWGGMTSALRAGNNAAALSYFGDKARTVYSPVFEALQPTMPQILDSFSALQRSELNTDVAEYAINRSIDGADTIFFLYFPRDSDGVWRLDAM